jgi:diguanylate cyclase (GGDEF)-like protein/PAS domain S-box-containing protein
MSVNASVDAGVLAQFLLVQSVVASLPDATVVPFVVQGLSDIPGVKSVRFSSMVKGGQEKALRYPLVSGPSRFGELILDVQEPEVFAPYADHIRNFVFMVGLILEERRQKRVIESHKHYLEQQVAERTNELAQQRDTAQRYLDVAGVMLMALDGNGRIVMINRKGAQLLGKPESALLGADWFDNFVLADERTMVRGVFDTLMSGETQLVERYENRIINAAGLERNMVWNNTLLRNDEGAVIGILSSAEDVTERRLAENALRESEENLAITLHSIGDAVIATQPDGRVTRMNPTAERLSGWKLAEAIGRPLSDVFRIINSDTRETVADPVQLVMRHGAVVGLAKHTVLVARDGREYQIADSAAPIRNAAGELVGVVLVFSDITEKYRIEEELRASEERHRLLADNASDVIWTMNLEGRLTYVSPSIEKLRGYTSTEAIGQSLGLMLTPESAARAIDGLEKTRAALDAGLPIPEFRRELEQTCKDGTTVWTEVTASGMHDAAGKFAGILGVTRDITERKRIELKLLESEATFRKLFEDSSDAILLIDGTGVFVECNQAALKLLKMTREQFLLSPLSSISPEFQPDGRRSAESAPEMIALAYSQGLHRFDWTCVNAEGGEFIVEVSLMPIAIKGQTMLHTAWRDITERKAFADRIEHLAFYDPLTDLPNRRLMRDRLEQAITSSARHNRHGALMLLDMDDFKTLNDTQGHDVGDQLLMEVARRLHASVREGDTVARHGGDEFVVILEDLNDDTLAATQAESVAVKILRAVSRAYLLLISNERQLRESCAVDEDLR